MKYSLILLVSTAALISVDGEIPDYIQVCKRNDPGIKKCIENSIYNLRPMLAKGIPDLGVPPLDPQHVEKLVLNLGPGLDANGHNLIIKGGTNFEIEDLVVDIKANTFTFTVSIPQITVNGTYEINAAILGIPLKGKGPIDLILRSIHGRVSLQGRKAVRGTKNYLWFPSMTLKLEISDYDIKLENLFEGDAAIGEATNKALNEGKAEILSRLIPEIERALIEQLLPTANNIVKHFTLEELFPES